MPVHQPGVFSSTDFHRVDNDLTARVGLRLALAGECHRTFRDLQPAVRYSELYGVVCVGRAEAAFRQAHRVRAIFIASAVDVRALGNGRSLRRTVDLSRRQIHSLRDADLIPRYALLRAVVDQGIVVARDGHGQLGRLDLQPAVRHIERYRIVFVGRAEICRFQAHRIRLIGIASAVDVRTLGNGRILRRTGDLSRRQIHSLGDADIVPRYALLRAIIGLFGGVAGDRHRHCLRCDCQLAGGEGLGGIVIRDVDAVCVNDCVCFGEFAIIIGIRIGALRGGVGDGQNVTISQAFDFVVIFVNLFSGTGDSRGEGTAFLLGAVINLLNVLHRDRQSTLSYGQRTKLCDDLVVAGIRSTPIDGVIVVTAAYRDPGSRNLKGDGIAGAEGDFTRLSSRCRSPCPADVRGPIAVVQGRAFGLRQSDAIVRFFGRRRGDGQRQGLDLQEAVTGIDRDGVVGIGHHPCDTRHQCPLCLTGNRVGAGVFFRDQRTVGAIQRSPDCSAVLREEQIALTAGDADISGFVGIIIKMLLIGVSKAHIEGLAGIIVRTAGAAAVGVPLVSGYADVHADGLYGQRSGNIDDAVVGFRISDGLRAFADLHIFRRSGAGAGIGLAAVKFQGCDGIAAHVAGYCEIRCIIVAAEQRRSVVGLGLVVGDDDQFLLIIDVDDQVAFIASDLISRLRSCRRPIQIGMVVNIPIRRLVLDGEGVAFFDVCRVGSLDGASIHIEIVHRDLRSGVGNILESDHVVFQGKLEFLGGLDRLIMLAQDIAVAGLGRQISGIHLDGHFHDIGGGTGHRYGLGFRDLDIRSLQDIIHRIGDLIGDRIVIEDYGILFFVEGKRFRDRGFVRHMPGHSRRILGDLITLPEVRIRYDLIIQDLGGCTLFIIMHGIADGILGPAGIEGDVLRYGLIPVIRRSGLIRRGEPALEGIVIPGGVIRLRGIEAVLVRLRSNSRTALGIIGHGAGRELEIAVEHQTGRHLGATGIRAGMFLIGVPPFPSCAFHRGIRNPAGQVTRDIIT